MSSSLLYLSSQVLQLHHISFPVIHKASKAYQVWPMIKEGGSVLAPLLNNTYTRLISQAFQEGSRKKRRMNKKGQKSPFLVSSVTHHQLSNIHFVAIDFQTGQKNRAGANRKILKLAISISKSDFTSWILKSSSHFLIHRSCLIL